MLLFIILILNYKSVGKKPELHSLSVSVANPGDTITLFGNYFGGEISRGRVYINEQMVYEDFIQSWSNKEITLTLEDDFASGMITVNNMFGESKPYLITSFKDVPRIEKDSVNVGVPHIISANYIDESNIKIEIIGTSFGYDKSYSQLELSSIDGEDNHLRDFSIISWDDDLIKLYLPHGINNLILSFTSNLGKSNEFALHNSRIPSVIYINSDTKIYHLEQRIDITDVVALGDSYINLFVPTIYEGFNQRKISSDPGIGIYNHKSNTYDYLIEVHETGEEFSEFLKTEVEVSRIETKIRKDLIGRIYDKNSPYYKDGFQKIPNIEINEDLKSTAVWLIRNTNNRFTQAEIVMNWVSKYIDIEENGKINSISGFENRSASYFGLVNIAVSMLRSIGVPARIVRGIIYSGQSSSYQWLEFYLPDGGWIPVDLIRIKKEPSYSIGKIESSRISFSRGYVILDYEKNSISDDFYALQNSSSNFDGNIESYRTIWHNIEVN